MNCKPGDLARIVWSKFAENIGAIVQVVSDSPNGAHHIYGHQWSCRTLYDLRSSMGVTKAGCEGVMPDAWLRPIRPHDGEDEMIRIAGKPKAKRVIHDTYVRTKETT